MNIPIIDAIMVQDSKGLVAGVSGDNLTKQITFVLARKDAGIDLAGFSPLISIEPVQGENYNVMPEMTYDDEKIYIIWRLTRFDTQYSGKLYVTVKLMQPTADGDVCVWQSNRGCFHITSSVAADADADTLPPNAFDTAIAQAAAHAASAQQYRDEAQAIKDSTEIEFVVEESRIGLRHIGDTTYTYTGDLKADAKEELDNLRDALAMKADASTTLAGYGIDDAYTKAEADAVLSEKADKTHKHAIKSRRSSFENEAAIYSEPWGGEIWVRAEGYDNKSNIITITERGGGGFDIGIKEDANHRFVTDAEKDAWNNVLASPGGGAGADGKSAYEIAVDNGFEGTEQDWLESLKGKDGADGADGKDGSNGLDGKDGVSVTHKWNGTTLTVTSASGTSSANLKGEKGDTGATGATGPAYTLTEADKNTIASAVKSSLPTLTMVGKDADGVEHTWTIYGS